MAFENLFIRTKRAIGGIELDAVISEAHTNQVRLTKNPVEFGVDITDHAIIEPKQLSIVAQVSDTPLGTAAFGQLVDTVTGLFGSSTSQNITRSNAAYNRMLQLMEARELIEVQTRLRLYPNMIITSLSTTQDKDSSRAVLMNMKLEEVVITESVIVKLDPAQLQSGSPTSQGSSADKRGRVEPVESTNKSHLKTFVDWISG